MATRAKAPSPAKTPAAGKTKAAAPRKPVAKAVVAPAKQSRSDAKKKAPAAVKAKVAKLIAAY